MCVDAARAGREPGSPRSTSVNDLKVNARINKFCTGYCRRRKTKTLKKFAKKMPGALLRKLSEAMRAAAEAMEPKK